MRKLICCLLLICFAAIVNAVPVSDQLLFHFKADALNLNNGDLVYEWPDAAVMDSSDGTARQRTGWGVPTFVTNAYKGFPAIQFAGPDPTTNAERTVLESGTWDWDINKPITVFMVCTGGRLLPDHQRSLAVGRPGGNGVHTFAVEISEYQSGARFNNGSMLTAVGASPFVFGDWHTSVRRVQAITQPISTFYYAVNGATIATPSQGAPTNIFTPVATGNKVLIGGGYANDAQNSGTIYTGELYDGDIAEIVVYNYLEMDQIEQVYNWLVNKYDKLMAHNPSPVCSAVDQGTFNVDKTAVSLSFGWNTGLDSSGSAPNSQIAGHWFYCAADEPNFVDVQPQWVSNNPVSATASLTISNLLPDKRYYWRVDESVYHGGQPSSAGDPNGIMGDVWFLDTKTTAPTIETQPTSQLIDLNGTATFTVTVSSVKPVTYSWYKSADATIDAGDTDLLTNSNTYSISPADLDDQGFYYCKVDNGSAEILYSNLVMLGVKRQIAHWTLNSVNYVGGLYQDVCTEDPNDFPIDPNLPPVTGSIVPNSQFPALGDCLNLTVEPMAAGWSKKVWAAAYTDNITVSAWVKWQGAEGITTNQGIVANQADAVDGVGNSNNWFLDIPASNDRVRFNVAGTGGGSATGPVLPTSEWVHVAGTVGSAGTKFYVNGKLEATNSSIKALINRHRVPFYLGCSQRNAAGILEIFNGSIDDVKVYNYQVDDSAVAQMYYDISNIPVCINPNSVSMTFDVAGGGLAGDEPDCLVDIKDFVEFASNWLNCGFYPREECP